MPLLSKEAGSLSGLRYLGLDLAKRESQISVLDDAGVEVFTRRFQTTRENILQLASELRPTDTIALEVTTNAISIARLLKSNSKARIILSNPIRTKVIAVAKVKTDKIDARVLAELARANYLPEVWLPDEDTESLRQFFSDRRSLVERRTEMKNTVHSILHRNLIVCEQSDLFGVAGRQWLDSLIERSANESLHLHKLDRLRLGSLLREIDRQDLLVADMESIIASYIATRPALRAQLDHLLSVPGVSLIVGAGVLAAIGDVKRFASAKKLSSYFGLVPSTRQSGDLQARHGRITKAGRSEARWLLVEAAEHLRKAPGPLRQLYTRISRKKGRNVAVVAVARKLAELCWHLLTKHQDYIYSPPRLTLEKRARVRFLAKRKLGVKIKSATARTKSQPALYGTGLEGRRVKDKIVSLASAHAEQLYQAIVGDKDMKDLEHSPDQDNGPTNFDPTRPRMLEWQQILEKVAANLKVEEISKRRTKKKSSKEEDKD